MGYLINLVLQISPPSSWAQARLPSEKVSGLLEAGARVEVIAPQSCEPIRALAEAGRVVLLNREYRAETWPAPCSSRPPVTGCELARSVPTRDLLASW